MELNQPRLAERSVGADKAGDFVHPLLLPDGAVGLYLPLEDAGNVWFDAFYIQTTDA